MPRTDTVQLEDAKGAVAVGTDGKKPARVLVRLSTYAVLPDADQVNNRGDYDRKTAAPVVNTIPLTTDSDGKATFSVSGLPDQSPTTKSDKYAVDVQIEAVYGSNAPGAPTTPLGNGTSAFFIGAAATSATAATATTGSTGLAPVKVAAGDEDYSAAVVFSTEAPSWPDATVLVKAASEFVVADVRGASNRATVTVVDQYADPIQGAEVSLVTDQTDTAGTTIIIGAGNDYAVGYNGSYTFGYQRPNAAAGTETLTATWVYTQDANGDGTADDPAQHQGTETVEWAQAATGNQTNQAIMAFDTETNTIFAGSAGSVWMITYDSNDRFDVGATGSESATTYTGFERALAKGLNLDWVLDTTRSGSRRVNEFTLSTS